MEDININQQMDKAVENNMLPSPIEEEQILPEKKPEALHEQVQTAKNEEIERILLHCCY